MSSVALKVVPKKTVNVILRRTIIQLWRYKLKTAVIAKVTGVSKRTIQRICQTWVISGLIETKKPGGRKPMFTPRMYRHLSYLITRARRNTRAVVFAQFREKFGPVSDSTLFRALRKLTFFRKPSRKRQILSAKHRSGRLAWVRTRRGLPTSYWSKIILWFILKHNIKNNIEKMKNLEDLKSIIRDCWAGIKGSYVKNLYDSIPRRLRAVQVHKGHLTKY